MWRLPRWYSLRRLLPTFALLATLSATVWPEGAGAATATISFGTGAPTPCLLNALPFTPYSFYVFAFATPTFQDQALLLGGFSGAEFAITGFDPNWIVGSQIASPAASSVVGDPLHGGVAIGFPACQAWASDFCWVLLYSVQFLTFQPIAPTTLRVVGFGVDPCQFPQSPILIACDAPVATRFCVGSGVGFINSTIFCDPTSARSADCLVAVEPTTWS